MIATIFNLILAAGNLALFHAGWGGTIGVYVAALNTACAGFCFALWLEREMA